VTKLQQPKRYAISTTEQRIIIPAGAKVVQLIPQSSVAVQLSLLEGQSNTASQFWTLPAGATYSVDLPEGSEEQSLFAYAGSAVSVDVLIWA